jgi:hypothetical protein
MWMLYVTDTNFAVVRRRKSFWLLDIDTTVDLPCEEVEYQHGWSTWGPSLHGGIMTDLCRSFQPKVNTTI